MGGAIPLTEIVAWLDINRITNLERRREVADHIRQLDLTWMDFHRRKHGKAKDIDDDPEST